MPQMYMSLKYEDWKALEDQCKRFSEIETAHTTTAGFYHKAFRLELGDLLIEFQGPLVKAPTMALVNQDFLDIQQQHLQEAGAKMQRLVDTLYALGKLEDGCYTFPDGDTWYVSNSSISHPCNVCGTPKVQGPNGWGLVCPKTDCPGGM